MAKYEKWIGYATMSVKRLIVWSIVLLGMNACQPSLEPSVSPSATAPPTKIPNTSAPTIHPIPIAETIAPEIVKVCPPEPEVEMNELGVDPKFMLFLTPNEEDPDSPSKVVFAYSWDDDSLGEYGSIPDIEDYKRYSSIGVTPGGDRLSFVIWKDDLVSQEHWTTALDGSDRQLIAEINFNERLSWISDDERVLIGLQNKEDYERRRSDWWMKLFHWKLLISKLEKENLWRHFLRVRI